MSQQDEKACVKQSKHILFVDQLFDQYAKDDHARPIFEIHLELSRAKMQLRKVKETFGHLLTAFRRAKKPKQFERIRAMRDQLRRQIEPLAGSLEHRVLSHLQQRAKPIFAREMQLALAAEAYSTGTSLDHAVDAVPPVFVMRLDAHQLGDFV